MTNHPLAAALLLVVLLVFPPVRGWSMDPLPLEPDVNSRLDEVYDHESRMFIMLYSLHGDGKVDYVTAPIAPISSNGPAAAAATSVSVSKR